MCGYKNSRLWSEIVVARPRLLWYGHMDRAMMHKTRMAKSNIQVQKLSLNQEKELNANFVIKMSLRTGINKTTRTAN